MSTLKKVYKPHGKGRDKKAVYATDYLIIVRNKLFLQSKIN